MSGPEMFVYLCAVLLIVLITAVMVLMLEWRAERKDRAAAEWRQPDHDRLP